MTEEGLVGIKIKLPDGSDIGPFRFSPASTVQMLKERIITDWPKGNPAVPKHASEIKLISFGKILENNKTVGQCKAPIVELADTIMVMHVVVQPSQTKIRTAAAHDEEKPAAEGLPPIVDPFLERMYAQLQSLYLQQREWMLGFFEKIDKRRDQYNAQILELQRQQALHYPHLTKALRCIWIHEPLPPQQQRTTAGSSTSQGLPPMDSWHEMLLQSMFMQQRDWLQGFEEKTLQLIDQHDALHLVLLRQLAYYSGHQLTSKSFLIPAFEPPEPRPSRQQHTAAGSSSSQELPRMHPWLEMVFADMQSRFLQQREVLQSLQEMIIQCMDQHNAHILEMQRQYADNPP